MKRKIRGCALSVALLVGLFATQDSAGTLQDENLLAGLPKGFVVAFSQKQGSDDIVEFIPAGETVHEWTRMVTVQIFRSMKAVAPETFAQSLRNVWISGCRNSDARKIKDVLENGYTATVWGFACPLNTGTGKPETMFMKLTGGVDALYSVQYAYRSALTRDEIKPAMDYLGGVRVCDTRSPDRPCPAGM